MTERLDSRPDPRLLEMPLQTLWSQVQEVRERVDGLLVDLSPAVREAAVMTVSELIENAIKYGEPVPGAEEATISIDLADGILSIAVKNGARSAESIRELQEHVERLQVAEDRAALYIARLQQCMMEPGGKARLGIYRIGYEGGFDLRCTYRGDVVTLVATRSLDA